MVTLRIEHDIKDFALWRRAFDRFADARKQAGVRAHRVHQPIGDPSYIHIDLDFDDQASAERFLEFLRTKVWSDVDSAPALQGVPVTSILRRADD